VDARRERSETPGERGEERDVASRKRRQELKGGGSKVALNPPGERSEIKGKSKKREKKKRRGLAVQPASVGTAGSVSCKSR
jgi:hypothetical protein